VGAAIVYIANRDYPQCAGFLRYLIHLSHFRWEEMADWKSQVCIDRETLFIPAGWDTLNHIACLHDDLVNEDDIQQIELLYSNVIKKPSILIKVSFPIQFFLYDYPFEFYI
jgi:hypothetical protein